MYHLIPARKLKYIIRTQLLLDKPVIMIVWDTMTGRDSNESRPCFSFIAMRYKTGREQGKSALIRPFISHCNADLHVHGA